MTEPNPKREAELLKQGKNYTFILEYKNGKLMKRWGYVISTNNYNIWFFDELRYIQGREPKIGILLNSIKKIEESEKNPRVSREDIIEEVYEDEDEIAKEEYRGDEDE